ncbi:MAG: transcription elongation factor GreA [Patescibacteria group bacterium]|nr:transcription elongation factor GreA [Patescibacteria group bacterium]
MENNKFLTREGLKQIKGELDKRKKVLRKEISYAIKDAKEQGDLSENAEYSEAKSRETENEKRIAELESVLKNSVVVRKNGKSKKIDIGSVVKVKTGRAGERIFRIVGSNEADPISNKISNESPIGAALMNKAAGDSIEVEAPNGKIKYQVLGVENK